MNARWVGRAALGLTLGIVATAIGIAGRKWAVDAALPSAQAAGALAPCTAAGQTHCVRCDGWASGICTETEAVIVRQDIQRHRMVSAGSEASDPRNVYPKEPCYECLMHSGCLDDGPPTNDSGHECWNLADARAVGLCTQALQCMLSAGCAATAVSGCYCGDAGVLTGCQGNKANGACAQAIAAGLGLDKSNGAGVTRSLTDTTKASGMASQILQCAQSNRCASCFP